MNTGPGVYVIANLKQNLKEDIEQSADENILGDNPLLDMSIIPASLQNTLLPLTKKRSKRKHLGARLFTAAPE